MLLTNVYKIHLCLCEEENVIPKYREQYQFRRAIAEYWINPDLVHIENPCGKERGFGSISLKSVGSPLSPITNPFASSCAELN